MMPILEPNMLALDYAALTTKMQGKYNEAIPMFKRFTKVYKADDAQKMKKWGTAPKLTVATLLLKKLSPTRL